MRRVRALATSALALGLAASVGTALSQDRPRLRAGHFARGAEEAPPRDPNVQYAAEGGPQLEVKREVVTGSQPKSVYITPDGEQVWVCNFGQRGAHNVYIYDANTLTKLGEIHFPGNAVEILFSPDGERAYISNLSGRSVEVINARNRFHIARVHVRGGPKTMALSPDGRTFYVTSYFTDRVSAFHTRSLRKIRHRRVGDRPRGIAVLPNGELMVAAFGDDYIQLFEERLADRIRRIPTCRMPRDLRLSPDAQTVFATCTDGTVQQYDIASGRALRSGETGENPRSLAMTRDARFAVTANFDSSDVSVVDFGEMRHATSAVPGASRLVGIAVHPTHPLRVYTTSWMNGRLFMLERATN